MPNIFISVDISDSHDLKEKLHAIKRKEEENLTFFFKFYCVHLKMNNEKSN